MSWSCTSLCSTWLRGVTWDAIWAPSDCASIAGEASETVCRAVGAGFCLAADRARWFSANAVWARGVASSSFCIRVSRSGHERRVVGTWGWSDNRRFRWEDVRRQFTGPLTAELHHSNRSDQHHSRRDCGPAPGRSAKKRPAEPVFAGCALPAAHRVARRRASETTSRQSPQRARCSSTWFRSAPAKDCSAKAVSRSASGCGSTTGDCNRFTTILEGFPFAAIDAAESRALSKLFAKPIRSLRGS